MIAESEIPDPALIRRLNAQGWLVKPPFGGGYFLVEQPATKRVMAWSAADPVKALTEFQSIIDGTTRGWALHPAWKDTMVADDVSAQQEPVFGMVWVKQDAKVWIGGGDQTVEWRRPSDPNSWSAQGLSRGAGSCRPAGSCRDGDRS